ncbi:MAG: hypothetical protein E7612_07580 [Ruminococcaceae bacterium]|nr:hypothetical protein [Oscillospiraceae bacterium]
MDERELKFLEMEKDVNSRGGNGEAVVAAYRELYGMHEIGLCSWLAKLFDPDIGGFYCSNSGRDTEWIEADGKREITLPDMESTYFSVILMQRLGIIKDFDEIPDWMREKIIKFTCSLQSEEDGHIYHPQWGNRVTATKHGRDLTAANGLAESLKFKLPYPTPAERLKTAAADDDKKDALGAIPAFSDHLKSKEAFLKYLENLDWNATEGLAAYGAGHQLASQASLIKAAGLGDVMCDFLDSIQNKESGFWGVIPGYPALNAFFKIGAAYNSVTEGRAMPNVDKVAYSAMDVMVGNDCNRTVCYQFNAWWCILVCYGAFKKSGNDAGLARLKAEVLRRAPECILATKRKTLPFKCEDGSYSYYRDSNFPGFPPKMLLCKEGDVDATTINSSGVLGRSLDVLELSKYAPKIYEKEGRDAFFDALRKPTVIW